ncbi:hypothetical protein ACLI4U_12340 [Natrialbaceae archaeon A-CW2]
MRGTYAKSVVLTQDNDDLKIVPAVNSLFLFYSRGVALLVVLSATVFISTISMNSLEGIAAVGVLGATGRFNEVLQTVEKEQKRATAERKAFQKFRREVVNVSPTTVTTPVSSTMTVTSNTASAGHTSLEKVRNLYEKTIMSVPHYEEEYGNNLQVSLAEEFNRDLQIAIEDGQQFSPPLKQALIEESMTAIERRDFYLEFLKHERRSLEVIREGTAKIDEILQDIHDDELSECSYGELIDDYRGICREIRHCKYLIDLRQQSMHTHNRNLMLPKGPFIYEYLYRNTRSNFPALDELIDRLETLHNLQQTIVDRLITD